MSICLRILTFSVLLEACHLQDEMREDSQILGLVFQIQKRFYLLRLLKILLHHQPEHLKIFLFEIRKHHSLKHKICKLPHKILFNIFHHLNSQQRKFLLPCISQHPQ